ncbi:MAG: hypothetical protein ABS36_05760 [Acidobacteria bacterium SCN 69-37]|nr:MAG: hypothetical protein ABS36_05760 [Acidobacteria bacterium SCN 69-37]
MSLATTLGVLIVAWPVALGLALVDRIDEGPSTASALVYVAASGVCHQQPARSFHTHGVQWPVCARCAGLYLAGPLGLLAAAGRRPGRRSVMAAVVAASALPTAITWAIEAAGLVAVPPVVRCVAALPLGAAIACALAGLARPADRIG